MAMHEAMGHNLMAQFSTVTTAPLWSALGSQLVLGDTCGQLKPFSMEQPSDAARDQVTVSKPVVRTAAEQTPEKETSIQFNKFHGGCKQPQTTISLQSTPPGYRVQLELGFGQPVVSAKYPYSDQQYGVFSTYAPHISGCIMLPLNSITDGGPIYVNAKQYHGIIRRRQSRAKAVMEKKVTKSRRGSPLSPVYNAYWRRGHGLIPYMHHSRHLHALRRPRGSGGRFLNTKNSDNVKARNAMKKYGEVQVSEHTGSQKSDVLQSESGTMNSSKEANGSRSNTSGSEVTSTYSRSELEHFPSNYLGLPFRMFSEIGDGGGGGIVMPTRWIVAADGGYNLKT